MFNLFFSLLVLAALVLVWYALAGRRWLKSTSAGSRFLAWIEPVEIALYRKSETLLMGRMLWVGSSLVGFYDAVALYLASSGTDITPITTRLFSFVPDDLRGITVAGTFGIVGLIMNWLRKRTAKPIEVVAAPTTPETEIAEAKVDATNAAAVVVADAATAAKAA